MVRYKRRARRYRRSTNTIKMKIQSFMDIATSDSSVQIISISAGGLNVMRRLVNQFGAYKYYKLGNIAVKLVPASTLPVDPSGLSYEAGENQVDPRDQLTPGMMRITNGEDVLDSLATYDETTQRGIYNNMLLDPRWFKWMLQSGVKRHATPRYWQIGQLHQDKWPGSTVNVPMIDSTTGKIVDTASILFKTASSSGHGPSGTPSIEYNLPNSSPAGLFQTGHRGILGWLPTDGISQHISTYASEPFLASVPEVEVMKIILPRAYSTKYYYRMFITETVYFKEPLLTMGMFDGVYSYRPLDVFHISSIQPSGPADTYNPIPDAHDGDWTGGNHGDGI